MRAATAYSGEAWAGDTDEKLGRVREGYLADLIAVDGNPLLDLSLLQDRHALLAIMKDGVFHKRYQGRLTRRSRLRKAATYFDRGLLF